MPRIVKVILIYHRHKPVDLNHYSVLTMVMEPEARQAADT
jgi:hypothetical protein